MKSVYFIRHKWDDKPGMAKALSDRELIGLHYNDINSDNPNDYAGRGRSAIQRLHSLVNGSGEDLVCADYSINDKAFMLIGPLDLEYGFKAEAIGDENGRKYWIKTAKLKNPKRVYYSSFPVLMATWPRGGTIVRWKQTEQMINILFENGKLPRDISSLAPAQIEGLCTSYLFDMKRIAVLGLPIGRTMKDWDIWGVSKDGKRVIAQVTHSRDGQKLQWKEERMKSDAEQRLIFAPESERESINGVEFVSLEEVWKHFIDIYDGIVIDHLLGEGAVYPNSIFCLSTP